MLTSGPMAETAYSFSQFRQSCRRHDVGELTVKPTQISAKTGQRLTGDPMTKAAI